MRLLHQRRQRLLRISPMIVPLIITAAGMFLFYAELKLVASFTGVVIAHTVLGLPFVVITVTATLVGFESFAGAGGGAAARGTLGVAPGDFVITDPTSLPAEIDDWFPFPSANELGAFGAVAVFRYQD